jgi:hypothetical protein
LRNSSVTSNRLRASVFPTQALFSDRRFIGTDDVTRDNALELLL